MPKSPDDLAGTTISLKISGKLHKEFKLEMRRTGMSRSALLKQAWREYMDRREATDKKNPAKG